MSVFICGSERDFVSNNDDVHKWELPAQVRECLDKLMSDGEDILIGDGQGVDSYVQEYLRTSQYKKVTVYVSGSKRRTRNNAGKWEEKHYRTQGRTAYAYEIEKDFRMAGAAEYGNATLSFNIAMYGI